MPSDVVTAYGEFRAVLDAIDRLRMRIEVPHDPRGLTPTRRRKQRVARPVHVYFARKGGTTHWKIGSSINPNLRVRAVQTGNDGELYLVHVVKGVDGRALERRLKWSLRHRKTRDRNDPQKGEWFAMAPTYVTRLVRHLRAGQPIGPRGGISTPTKAGR